MCSKIGVIKAFTSLNVGGIKSDLNKEQTLAKAELWAAVLMDVSDEELQRMAMRWLRGGNCWMPTPGQLLALRAPEPEADWENGWRKLKTSMRRRPPVYTAARGFIEDRGRPTSWGTPEQDKAISAGLAAVGGWDALMNMREGDGATRAAFRDVYKAAYANATAGREDRAAALAVGVANKQITADDAREAMDPSTPALRVLEGGR